MATPKKQLYMPPHMCHFCGRMCTKISYIKCPEKQEHEEAEEEKKQNKNQEWERTFL